ncbi:hypothetical protein ACFL50_02385 [Candidatus Latescibacterota bacterium]
MKRPGIKSILKISLFLLFVVFVIAGIMKEEVWDIISNATLICYSCIGLK